MKLILAAAFACTLALVTTGCDRNDSRRGTYEAPGNMDRQQLGTDQQPGQQSTDHPVHQGEPGEARDVGTEPTNQNYDRDNQIPQDRGVTPQEPGATN